MQYARANGTVRRNYRAWRCNKGRQAVARTKGEIARGREFAEAAMEMAWQTDLLLDELEEAEAEFEKNSEENGKGFAS